MSHRLAPLAPQLSAPEIRGDAVERSRLVESLCAFGGREVVISAPAGYGKSTVAAQWAKAESRRDAWVTIDEEHRDPIVLLTHLGLALDGIEPVPEAALHVLTRATLDATTIVRTLVEVLATRSEPFVLLLDDVHRLASGPSHDLVLPALVTHVPAGSVVALITREPPPVPANRAEMTGAAAVLGARDLAMTPEEAATLLRRSGVDAQPEVVEGLWGQTEGWPAGLYMAALAMRDTDVPAVTAADVRFAGSHRRVSDFFLEEVLAALPDDDVEFLLATAVLGQCSGSLCDAALGRHDSGAVLERLARENRFVVTLDPSGEWYRYHHLFADMLVAQGRRRDSDRARGVARRASAWYAEHGDADPAIRLALAADDRELAAALVWRFAPTMQSSGRLATVARWIGAHPAAEVERTPTLAVPAAWNALMLGEIDELHRLAAAIDLVHRDAELPDGTDPAAAAALLRAITAADGLTAMRDAAATARLGHPEHSAYRALAGFLEAAAMGLLGDLDGARARTAESTPLARVVLVPTYAHLLAQQARLELAAGDEDSALVSVEDALAVVRTHELDGRPAMALIHSVAALLHHLAGDRVRAEDARRRGIELLPRLKDTSPYQRLEAQLELTHASVMAADHETAAALLRDAQRRLRHLPDAGTLPARLEATARVVAERAPRAGVGLVEPLSPAELRVLHWLPTHLSFGEIGTEVYLSRNTVKSHAMAIYRKLGVTSRSAAVKEAGRLGYLRSE